MLIGTIVLFFINFMILYQIHILHEDLENIRKAAFTPQDELEELEPPACEEVGYIPQFKSWMDYRAITCKTSRQWTIQELATTDENGFRRVENFYICAMGTQYGQVGDCFSVSLDSGVTIHVIKGDEKQDIHTIGGEGYQGVDGSVLEFIVDSTVIPDSVKKSGDCSILGLDGTVKSVSHINSIIQWQ